MAQCIAAECQQPIHVQKKGITWQVKHLKINQIYYDYKPCTNFTVKLYNIPSIGTNKCVNSVEKNVNTLYINFLIIFSITFYIWGMLGAAERACNWIACKINKILHNKENTEDSSAI